MADLLELSGVSRKAFYEHFADKQACFLATLEEILGLAMEVTASRLRADGTREEQLGLAIGSFVEQLVDQPAAGRLCLVEAYAAGPEAIARVAAAIAGFQEMANRYFEGVPEMAPALIGGLRKIVQTRLCRGEERELIDLVPDLVTLGLSYRPPPEPLRAPRRRRAAVPSNDHRPTDPSERLIWATTSVVASKGYPATTIADVVKIAGTSMSTFYEHFAGKEEAFAAALYSGRARMLGATLPAYRRARCWPLAIRAVTETTLAYMEAEPNFAQLIAVDVYAAGPHVLERRDLAIESAQHFIDDGVEEYAPDLKPIAREAITSACYAMLGERVRSQGTENLRSLAPLATYMALSPFLGAEAACEVANGGDAPASPAAN